MVNSRLVAAAPLLVGALVLAGCGGNADTTGEKAAQGCPTGLGLSFMGALSGPNGDLNTGLHNGAKLAVDQHNSKTGACHVTLTDLDTQGEPEGASKASDRVADDQHTIGIIGPAFSGEARSALPTLDRAGLVSVSASATNPDLTQNQYKTFFRVINNDWAQAPTTAAFLTKTLHRQRIFVIDDGSKYGKGIADIVRQTLGPGAVGTASVFQGQAGFGEVVEKVTASGADAIFYGGYFTEAGNLLKDLRGAGLGPEKLAFVTDDAVKDDAFLEVAGAAAEGTYITCPCLPPEKSDQTFIADYTKEFGAAPESFAAEGYDAATVLLHGIESGKTSRSSLLSYVADYNAPGLTKNISFDRNGDVTETNIWAYQVRNGHIQADKIITTVDG